MSARYIVTDNGHKVRNIPVPNSTGAWGAAFVTPEGTLDVTIATNGSYHVEVKTPGGINVVHTGTLANTRPVEEN